MQFCSNTATVANSRQVDVGRGASALYEKAHAMMQWCKIFPPKNGCGVWEDRWIHICKWVVGEFVACGSAGALRCIFSGSDLVTSAATHGGGECTLALPQCLRHLTLLCCNCCSSAAAAAPLFSVVLGVNFSVQWPLWFETWGEGMGIVTVPQDLYHSCTYSDLHIDLSAVVIGYFLGSETWFHLDQLHCTQYVFPYFLLLIAKRSELDNRFKFWVMLSIFIWSHLPWNIFVCFAVNSNRTTCVLAPFVFCAVLFI